jgi:hypothetical protein
MEAWTDSWFKQTYKFAKGNNDARKAFIKKGLLGGGGDVIPEYKKMNGKNVLSRPKTALIFMELFFQTVRFSLSLLFWSAVSAPSLLQTNGDDSSDEQRREDLKDMVENLVKFVSYLNKIQDAKPNRLSVDAAFLAKFHACNHEEHCAYLHDKECTVFQMATALHVILTGLGLYSAKPDAECTFFNSPTFKGETAVKELTLLLVMAGTDLDRTHYSKTGGEWIHNAIFARCVIPVPGVGLSQLDPRNQEALGFVHAILKGVASDERPTKCPELTANGLFKSKKFPTDFFCAPVFMDGWPKPQYEPDAPVGVSTKSSRRREARAATSDEEEEDQGNSSLAS